MIYSILCCLFFLTLPDHPVSKYDVIPDSIVEAHLEFLENEIEEDEFTIVSTSVHYYYDEEGIPLEVNRIVTYSINGNLVTDHRRISSNILPYISFVPSVEESEIVQEIQEDIEEVELLVQEIEEIEEEIVCLSCKLTSKLGRVKGPSGEETYYNLDMSRCVERIQSLGYEGEYWVRDDGVKMFGDYVMIAADFATRPLGTLVETSLGTGIVVDTGEFVETNPTQIDIAVTW